MPNVKWRSTGGRAVIEDIKRITGAYGDQLKTQKENAAESRRLDRVARDMIRGQTTELEKYRQKAADVTQVLQTQRGVTREMAEKELRRLKEQYLGAGAAAKKAAAEQAAAAEKARQTLRGLETESERYNRQVLEMGRLYRQGLIPLEKYKQGVQQLRAELSSTKEAQRQAAEAQRAAARAAKEAAAQQAAEQERVKRLLQSLETESERYRREVMALKREHQNGVIPLQKYLYGVQQLRAGLTSTKEAAAAAAKAQRDQAASAREAAAALAASAKQNQSAAAAIVDRNLSPLERYKRDYRDLVRVYKTGELSLRDKRREAARLRTELESAGQAGKAAFGSNALAQLKSYATGIGGVLAAAALLRSEIEAQRDMAERASQSQQSQAGARRELKLNLLGVTKGERDQTLKDADRIARELNLPQEVVDDTVKNAVSAASTPARGVAFAESALNSLKDVQGGAEFAAGVIDIGNALDTDDPNLAKGFIFSALQRSRVTDPRKLAQNLPRVVVTGKSYGLRSEESAAFFNALTVAGADPYGEVSRTAAINVFDGLEGFFTEDVVKRYGLDPRRVGDSRGRLGALLGNRELAREFSDTVGVRAAGIGAVRGLFEGLSPEARETLRFTLGDLSDYERVRRSGAEGDMTLNTGGQELTAEANRVVRSAAQQSRALTGPLIDAAGQKDFVDLVRRAESERGTWNPRTLVAAQQFLAAHSDATPQELAAFGRNRLNVFDQQARGGRAEGEQVDLLRQAVEKLERIAQASEKNPLSNPQAE